MYGIIHNGAKDAVLALKGPDGWDRVAKRSGFNDQHLISAAHYDDDLTETLIMAISEELGMDREDALRAFGQHWITYITEVGYKDIIEMAGDSLELVLTYVDRMHSGLKSSLPHAKMPNFELLPSKGDTLMLSYRSHRVGYAPFVEGALHGLINYFNESRTVHVSSSGKKTLFRLERVTDRTISPAPTSTGTAEQSETKPEAQAASAPQEAQPDSQIFNLEVS